MLKDGRVAIFHSYSSSYYLYGMIITIDGNSFTAGTDTQISDIASSGRYIEAINLIDDTFFVAHCYGGETTSIGGWILGLDEDTDTLSNIIGSTQYETQVRPATSLPCNGVASTSGEGGDDTGHKDIVSVYVREKVPVLKTGDIIPKAWTSVILGTEYQAEGITLKASSYYTSTSYQYLSYACDNSETSFWMARANNGNDWVMWIFPEATKITKMKLKFDSSTGGSIIAYIQGSNNESDWTNLHTVTSARTSLTEISLDNTDYYTHYKILFETTGTPCLYDWQVSEYEVLE